MLKCLTIFTNSLFCQNKYFFKKIHYYFYYFQSIYLFFFFLVKLKLYCLFKSKLQYIFFFWYNIFRKYFNGRGRQTLLQPLHIIVTVFISHKATHYCVSDMFLTCWKLNHSDKWLFLWEVYAIQILRYLEPNLMFKAIK